MARFGRGRGRGGRMDARNRIEARKQRKFDARTRINSNRNQQRIRINLVPSAARNSFNRVKRLQNFTVVTPASTIRGTAIANKANLKQNHPQNRPNLVRTIENSRLTMSGNTIAKTIVNDIPSRFQDRPSVSRPAGIRIAVGRGLPARRGRRQVAGRSSAAANVFRSALDAAQTINLDESMDDLSDEAPPTITRQSVIQRLAPPKPKPPTVTPGFKVLVSNLAHTVTAADVQELCSAQFGLITSKLVEPGVAVASFKQKKHAESLLSMYNGRELDGVPMQLQLLGNSITPTKPKQQLVPKLKLRTPQASTPMEEDQSVPAARIKVQKKSLPSGSLNPDRELITQALFQNTKQSTVTSTKPVTFTVKI